MVRWANEEWVLRTPDNDKIYCKDCAFRKKDVTVKGYVLKGSEYGYCDVYDMKPTEILYDGEKCPYYVSDKD